jgi:major type 1 subunit fimbrin (pilin)
MKKTIVALAGTLCAISSSLVMAAPSIEFVGEVSEYTCEPTINGNANGVVLLPTVATTALATAGATTGETNFNIDLPGDCSNATNIVLNGYSVTEGILGNTAPTATAATNVGLELLDPAGAPIILSGATNVPVTIANNQVAFGVQYKALAADVTAGQVKGTAEYTVSYK